jgi:hypothetical protein
MPAKSTAPTACLVIESSAVTSNPRVGTDLVMRLRRRLR